MANEQDVAFRIQERILRDMREELGVERVRVKILKARLDIADHHMREHQQMLRVQQDEFAQALAERDSMVEMLKKRVNSVNDEYNKAWKRDPPDVYNISGSLFPYQHRRMQETDCNTMGEGHVR